MTQLITVDFESYYSKDFGFSKLTTEEYVSHPEFEVIGVGVKVDDAPAQWFSGSMAETRQFLSQFKWRDAILLCHNTMFDGAIMKWKFGITPSLYADTLCMARALHGVDAGGSLKALAEKYNIGQKGTEVEAAIGKRRADFTPEELERYGEYCINDVELTYKLFALMGADFPENELNLIDMTLRMFITPRLYVDSDMLEKRLTEMAVERKKLLGTLVDKLGCSGDIDPEEAVRRKLSSNKQFADVLKSYGIKPPMKTSLTTGKQTLALAKNDEGFIELLEGEDEFIQHLCAVRLGTKSTIEESRIQRFIEVGKRHNGRLPIPLKYYGAHTGRWAGSDKVNFQNLPSRDKKKKTLKNAVMAPEGYVVINCDSSQIEARVLAWLAGQDDLVEAFTNKRDVYCEFATKVYEREITKDDPIERFVGKTCIAEGTLVLCHAGWKPIEDVTTDDLLWDGQEWVCHQGLLNNGIKPTLNLCGVWLTPDHQVWSGTQWLEAQSVVVDVNTLCRALDTAAENLPSQAMWPVNARELNPSSCAATAAGTNIPLTTITSRTSRARGAPSVLNLLRLKNGIGSTLKQCLMTLIAHGFLTGWPQLSHAVTARLQSTINITEAGVYQSTDRGERIVQNFSVMCRRSTDGITRSLRWIGLTLMAAMYQTISGSSLAVTTSGTSARSRTLKRVFDILNSGSRNRFTILTDSGPLIVHNCILGLGYGTGAKKLRHTLKTQPPGADIKEDTCKEIVDLYRSTNDKIVELWNDCDRALLDLMAWPKAAGGKKKKPYYLGHNHALTVHPEGIRLPNGLYIRYKNLRVEEGQIIYDSRKGTVNLWGGSVVENVVQALARIVVGEQMLNMMTLDDTYQPVLTVHDAAVCVVPEDMVKTAMQDIVGVMSTPPSWGPTLPVACEAKFAQRYGGC